MFEKIVVVCTGNICRSPIAEALLKDALPERDIFSAGTFAMVGAPADPLSIAVAQLRGLDLSKHVAQQLTLPMLQAADLVLTLDATHSDWINRRHPQFRGKVHKLGKWLDDADVPDPYRRPQAQFEAVTVQMEDQVAAWLKRLK